MGYKFQSMTQEQAEEIANDWRYNKEYSFYNMNADQEDLQEFLDPTQRGDSYVVTIKNSEV